MAEQKKEKEGELNLDGAAKSSRKKLIIGAVLGLIGLIGGTVGVTIMLVGGDGMSAGRGGAAGQSSAPKNTIYIPVKTMTVNFADKGVATFLQLSVSIMTYDPELVELVNNHMPVIRNDMLNLLGTQSYREVSTAEGKEALRVKLLFIVQQILMEQEGRGGIEAIYFTRMIMQ